jgi:tetratricopeptide (TPR) repeat protein
MTNRFGEAIDAFARVDLTRGWMKDWDYYLRWPSLAYHARGEFDRELSQIREHRTRFPRSSDLCLLELRALAGMGRLQEIDRVSATCNALPTAVPYQAALTHHFIAKELRTHRQDAAAIAHADSAVAGFHQRSEQEPDNVGLRQGMAFSYLEGRHWAEARALYEALDKTTPCSLPGILTSIGIAAGRQGDVRTADSLLARVSADTSMRPSWIALYKARISSSLGREEQALEALREAVRRGLAPMEIIHYDVGLERLHGTRGWKELMQERR